MLVAGAAFVVPGTRALDEADWLSSIAAQFADHIVLSAPARERRLRSRGAVRTLSLDGAVAVLCGRGGDASRSASIARAADGCRRILDG